VPEVLWGREPEMAALRELLDRLPETGGALVLYGQPGVGKSSILAAAAAEAERRHLTVLSAVGVQTEFHLPFAGLRALVPPLDTDRQPAAIA